MTPDFRPVIPLPHPQFTPCPAPAFPFLGLQSCPSRPSPVLTLPQIVPLTIPLSASAQVGFPTQVLSSPLKLRCSLKPTHSEPLYRPWLPLQPGPCPSLTPPLPSPHPPPHTKPSGGGEEAECLPQPRPPCLCPQTWTSATACRHRVTVGAARTRLAASCACAPRGTRLRPTEPAARVRDWACRGEGKSSSGAGC